jgi:transcriptional regulator with XRE-family HTH domain
MASNSSKAKQSGRVPRRVPPAVGRALGESAAHLVTWRKLRGLTQAQLADRADVSLNTVRRLEAGDGGVTFENLLRILRALGIAENLSDSLDPYRTDLGRLRSEEQLPARVRPRKLS